MKHLENKILEIFGLENTKESSPGFAVGILVNNKTYYITHGKASIENNLPITRTTKFHIASITKYFTSLIFDQVENEGMISRYDLLSHFFDDYFLKDKEIRLTHLLLHRSGLRDQWDLSEFAGWRAHDPITSIDILELFKKQISLNFIPNTYYSYSNTNFTLLALILEKVTGKSIRQLLDVYILKRFGLKFTGYYSYDESIPQFANGYKKISADIYRKDNPNFDVIGSTSMYSCVEDLINFEKNLFNQSSVANNLSRSDSENRQITFTGGLIDVSLPSLNFQMHSGWDYGYSSFLLRLRDTGTSVVLLSNLGIPRLYRYALQIIALVSDRQSENQLTRLNFLSQNTAGNFDYQIAEGAFLNYESNVILNITKREGCLYLDSDKLIVDGGSFLISNSINTFDLIDLFSFALTIIDSRFIFSYLAPENSAINRALYVGTYSSSELNISYQVLQENDELIIKTSRFTRWDLNLITPQYFKSSRFTLKFNFSNGQVIGFKLSTMRSWNIEFQRL